jgi:serine/threonine protein kinase
MRQDLRLAPGNELQDWLILESRPSSDAWHSWIARNLLTDQLADLRIYDPELVPASMVVREIHFLTELCHPGFPRLLGHFPYRGAQVILTNHIEGLSLAELIQMYPRGIPLEMAENAGRTLLAAINHLHGLPGAPVHRALHPGNVLVDESMNIFVSGLAFAESSSDLDVSETLYFNAGDARYEAPEVFGNPAAASVVSNVYSCAAILFELFTGRRAFDSDETLADKWFQDVAYLHQSLPAPRVSDYAPWVPERITTAVDQSLAKNPSERPENAILVAHLMSGEALPLPDPVQDVEALPLTTAGAVGRRGLFGWFGAGK